MSTDTTLFTTSKDGLPLASYRAGGGPVTLVFVHGWCGDSSIWTHQVEAYRDRFATISLDLAGHGRSGLGRSSWSIPAFGEDVARVVEEHSSGPVILVGHSMAGDIIVDAALRLTGRVLGLVGIDTLWDVEKQASAAEIERILEPFRRDYQATASDYVRNLFLPEAEPDLVKPLMKAMLGVPSAVGLGALEGLLRNRQRLRESLRQLDVPIALINSSDWRETNLAAARAYGMEVRSLPKVGHFAMLERPEALRRILDVVFSEFSAAQGPPTPDHSSG